MSVESPVTDSGADDGDAVGAEREMMIPLFSYGQQLLSPPAGRFL